MWQIIRAEATDFCSFRELDYTYNQGVTTLVFGDNKDNCSQKSNGSGKSALIEVLAFGIAGTALRKVANDELINDASDKAKVSIQLRNTVNNDELCITRHIVRKGSTAICVTQNGVDVGKSSVAEHNKYILDTIGITADDLFNTFILSKHKYQNFLSAPDKEKKEIINRFSNGIMVDKAIEKIQSDYLELNTDYERICLSQSNMEGKIQALTEQIETEKENAIHSNSDIEQKKAHYKEVLVTKRRELRLKKEELEKSSVCVENAEYRLSEIKKLEAKWDEIDFEDIIVEAETLSAFHKYELSNWREYFENIVRGVNPKKERINKLSQAIKELEEKQVKRRAEYEAVKEKCDTLRKNNGVENEKLDLKASAIEKQISDNKSKISALMRSQDALELKQHALNKKLKGTVSCPKCNHEFVLEEPSLDVSAIAQEVDKIDSEIKQIDINIESITASTDTSKTELSSLNKQYDPFESEIKEAKLELERIYNVGTEDARTISSNQSCIAQLEREISSVEGSLEDMVNKIYNEIYRQENARLNQSKDIESEIKRSIQSLESSIEITDSMISSLSQVDIQTIVASIEKSIKSFTEELLLVKDERLDIESKINSLKQQESNFVKFKTYLANTKIETLANIMNEFLEQIGSDLRIKISGYTVLKTGKVRDKISISLLRDGFDAGSFGKFSAGEQARINIASILAMHKLININCEAEKGLDLLVLDEILDSTDSEGIMSILDSLNHAGITTLFITHIATAENYRHTLRVVKQNGASTIANG